MLRDVRTPSSAGKKHCLAKNSLSSVSFKANGRCVRPIMKEVIVEFRSLGGSGFKVPVLSFGTGTFGGKGDFFGAWGTSDQKEASRLVDICLEAGVTLFDTADVYSDWLSEEYLGKAIG